MWGIEHTSLIHAYLCVATTPIIIAGGTWILRRPISRGELGGTALGAVGTVLLTLGPAAKGSQVRARCGLHHCSSCVCHDDAIPAISNHHLISSQFIYIGIPTVITGVVQSSQ